jgi:hypothetical protein
VNLLYPSTIYPEDVGRRSLRYLYNLLRYGLQHRRPQSKFPSPQREQIPWPEWSDNTMVTAVANPRRREDVMFNKQHVALSTTISSAVPWNVAWNYVWNIRVIYALNVTIFWDMTPFSLENKCWRYHDRRLLSSLYFSPWRWRKQVPPKHW